MRKRRVRLRLSVRSFVYSYPILMLSPRTVLVPSPFYGFEVTNTLLNTYTPYSTLPNSLFHCLTSYRPSMTIFRAPLMGFENTCGMDGQCWRLTHGSFIPKPCEVGLV